ncbi:MAG: AraC family transcriptional regulator [Pseudomonadota bacterium]
MSNADILTEVFSTLRLDGDLYFPAILSGDVAVELPAEQRRIRFHLVRQGRCWIGLPGGEPAALSEGDMAIIPNGAAQIIAAAPGATPRPLPEILTNGALADGTLRYGEGDRRTSLLCGFCSFDEGIDHPLLATLPKLMVLRPGELGAEPWTIASLRLLALEADLAVQGTKGILGRLLEVIFIQAVRRLSASDERPAGFIAALADTQLSRALEAMHQEPERAWTIGDLANQAGMSRARFAARFISVVGLPPIGYLTVWRLIKARGLLATSDLAMIDIAERCGYASVPSFSRRFARHFGVGPGAYRRFARSG